MFYHDIFYQIPASLVPGWKDTIYFSNYSDTLSSYIIVSIAVVKNENEFAKRGNKAPGNK
ncbi:hypothetical protein [Methyloprofundus sp.]|uniref:hypothetical protein n=1 Tax=Methyloprofundus sp. TaxID=2020875 RepID=UPI003D0D0EB4